MLAEPYLLYKGMVRPYCFSSWIDGTLDLPRVWTSFRLGALVGAAADVGGMPRVRVAPTFLLARLLVLIESWLGGGSLSGISLCDMAAMMV